MSAYSIKNQEKVLKILISLCEKSSTPWLYCPTEFERNFPFVAPETLTSILAMLESKGYVRVVYGDYPNSFNIETIEVTPQGLNYAPQKFLTTKEKWEERAYGFFVGIVLGSVATYFIQKVLDHIFLQ